MASVGRPRIFQNELELSKAFEEYKESLAIEAEKWLRVQYVGKDGQRMTDAQKVPMTMEGFYIFCRKNYGDVKAYFENREDAYNDFSVICSHIKDEIRNDQITGGLLGFYNPSITQRLNNLKEATTTELTGKDGGPVQVTGMQIL
jgi:hypothetical protein